MRDIHFVVATLCEHLYVHAGDDNENMYRTGKRICSVDDISVQYIMLAKGILCALCPFRSGFSIYTNRNECVWSVRVSHCICEFTGLMGVHPHV